MYNFYLKVFRNLCITQDFSFLSYNLWFESIVLLNPKIFYPDFFVSHRRIFTSGYLIRRAENFYFLKLKKYMINRVKYTSFKVANRNMDAILVSVYLLQAFLWFPLNSRVKVWCLQFWQAIIPYAYLQTFRSLLLK